MTGLNDGLLRIFGQDKRRVQVLRTLQIQDRITVQLGENGKDRNVS
jgi:hypothetical protein